MTIITPAVLAELRWLATSPLALAVIDKAVLAELIVVWEASRQRPAPDPTLWCDDPRY